jgi:hypothetical protein
MRQAHLDGAWDRYEACQKCNLWSLWQDSWLEAPGSRPSFDIPGVDFAK